MSDQPSPTPLFVVGPLRAGTTFLRLILGMHPEIHVFGEFEEAVDLLGDTGFPDIERYRSHLSTHRAFNAKKLEVDPAAESYQAQVLDLWKQLTERAGETTYMGASIHSRFDRCPELWPSAKYVHLMRDPRDVARSCIGMGWVGNVFFGASYWIEAERTWDRLVEHTSEHQRHEVRYEELVKNPVEVLTGICEFLGLTYDEVMLDYPKHSTYGPPQASLAEQWKRKLSPREIELVEFRVGSLLTERGYSTASSLRPPSRVERSLLYMDNRFKRAQFGVRRFGLPLWLRGRLAKVAPSESFRQKTQREMNEVITRHLR